MKAFILAACLVTIVSAINHEKLQIAYQNLNECAKMDGNVLENALLKGSVWYCAMSKCGMINESGILIKETAFEYCEHVTINTNYCKKMVSECIKEANQGSGSNNEKSLAIIECSIKRGVMILLAKLI